MGFEKTFSSQNYNETKLEGKEFEQCLFKNCDFSGCNLSNIHFIDCLFENCNLSIAKVDNARFQTVLFRNSKLMGINFEPCKDFGLAMRFENCVLDFTSFARKKMGATLFKDCKIADSNFDQTDLNKASFQNCDLTNTLFSSTNLTGADFSTSKNFLIDPETNTIKKARFSRHDLVGLLYRHEIIVD